MFPYYLRKNVKVIKETSSDVGIYLASFIPTNWVASTISKQFPNVCSEISVSFHDSVSLRSLSWVRKTLIGLAGIPFRKYDIPGTIACKKVPTLSNFTAAQKDLRR